MLPLTLFFIYRHDYVKDSFSFWGDVFQVKIDNCSPKYIFLIKPFLMSTFNEQKVLNK